jgi:hypothetical protein
MPHAFAGSCLSTLAISAAMSMLAADTARAYPPGVGILANNRDCMTCHVANGPWGDEAGTIVDILEPTTKKSLRGADGAFHLEVVRGMSKTILTVIGRRKAEPRLPTKNAWLYVDPTRIGTSALSKFAPGWEVNLPMACRVTGDKIDGVDGAALTVLPMTIRPGDGARDAEVELQVMLTAGESVKGKPKEGVVSNYVMRRLMLKVLEK